MKMQGIYIVTFCLLLLLVMGEDIQKSKRTSLVSGTKTGEDFRLSYVWRGDPIKPTSPIESSFQFRHRWIDYSFSTKIEQRKVIPNKKHGVVGVMLGDVCFNNKFIPCVYGLSYGVLDKVTWLLNELAREKVLSFWALLGDNFYDQDGSNSEEFFSKLDDSTLDIPLYTTVGNHDFWTLGAPSSLSYNQLGYGYTQFYMMDVEAMANKKPSEFPFNFKEEGDDVTDIPSGDNFFHYSFVGNVGMISFSAAHRFEVEQFRKVCKYFSSGNPGQFVDFIFLIGHWSTQNLGCQDDMYTSGLFKRLTDPKGELHEDCFPLINKIYFVEGHYHENRVINENGFRVAGQGMHDTGNFGFPIIKVKGDRMILYYVKLSRVHFDPLSHLRFAELKLCSKLFGIMECLDKLSFVETWFNVSSTEPKRSRKKNTLDLGGGFQSDDDDAEVKIMNF